MTIRLNTDVRLGRGRLLTPTPFQFPSAPDTSKIAFGGIQGEARFIPAASMGPRSLAELTTNGVHRIVLPNGVTTTAYATIEVEEWWLKDTLNVGFEWVNEAAGSGDIRWQWQIRTVDIFVDTLAAAAMPINRTLTKASVGPGVSATEVIAATGFGFPFELSENAGILGSFYSVAITRIGGDAADTLAGDISIIGVSYGRSDDDL